VREADVPNSPDKYVALFNANDAPPGGGGTNVEASLAGIGLTGPCHVRDLWKGQNLDTVSDGVFAEVPPHGAVLLRVGGGGK
jgi:alpha-galactosidase